MAFIWLHIFHVPRAYLGLQLIGRMPRSHDIIMKLPLTSEHSTIEAVNGAITQSVSKIFMEYTEKCKGFFLAYGIMTVLCFLFDVAEFLIQFIRFGYKGDENS
jgi:hypothetical protein